MQSDSTYQVINHDDLIAYICSFFRIKELLSKVLRTTKRWERLFFDRPGLVRRLITADWSDRVLEWPGSKQIIKKDKLRSFINQIYTKYDVVTHAYNSCTASVALGETLTIKKSDFEYPWADLKPLLVHLNWYILHHFMDRWGRDWGSGDSPRLLEWLVHIASVEQKIIRGFSNVVMLTFSDEDNNAETGFLYIIHILQKLLETPIINSTVMSCVCDLLDTVCSERVEIYYEKYTHPNDVFHDSDWDHVGIFVSLIRDVIDHKREFLNEIDLRKKWLNVAFIKNGDSYVTNQIFISMIQKIIHLFNISDRTTLDMVYMTQLDFFEGKCQLLNNEIIQMLLDSIDN